jgi:Protein of unknown function (DUF1552)
MAEFSRRRLVTSAVVSAIAPFLLRQRNAQAAPQRAAKRLIIINGPYGACYPSWRPSFKSETDFNLGPSMLPLEPFKKDILIIDGIDNEAVLSSDMDIHARSFITTLTGSSARVTPDKAELANGISVDQFVARELNAPTKYRSLEFGSPYDIRQALSWSGPGVPVLPMAGPRPAFARIFGQFTVDPKELQHLVAERKSVLDAVSQEFASVGARLGVDGKHKLDAHLTGLRELEKKFGANGSLGPVCSVPVLDPSGMVEHSHENRPHLRDFQIANIDLMVMSMVCDLTRVASCVLVSGGQNPYYDWTGNKFGHHENSHCLIVPAGDPDAVRLAGRREEFVRGTQWSLEMMAHLLKKLKETPEGTGNMLDNSLVMYCTDFGDPHSHSTFSLPFILAGKAGGHLNPGRYLKYSAGEIHKKNGVRHNDLLVSVCHAMGLNSVTTFGDPNFCSGPLPRLTA